MRPVFLREAYLLTLLTSGIINKTGVLRPQTISTYFEKKEKQ